MGKIKTEVSIETLFHDFKSLKDLGYNQAITQDATENQARYALDHIVGFPDECPDTARAELDSGYLLRYIENMKRRNNGSDCVSYAVVDGNYIKVTALNADQFEGKERLEITPAIAINYTTHEFGRLHETRDPQYKLIIKEMRDSVSDYCSGRYKALVRSAKALLNKGTKRSRSTTKTFADRVIAAFDDPKTGLDKAVLVAVKRGDPTADSKKFAEAKVAFLAVWNHQ